MFICLICQKEFRTEMGSRGVRAHIRNEHNQEVVWGTNASYETSQLPRSSTSLDAWLDKEG